MQGWPKSPWIVLFTWPLPSIGPSLQWLKGQLQCLFLSTPILVIVSQANHAKGMRHKHLRIIGYSTITSLFDCVIYTDDIYTALCSVLSSNYDTWSQLSKLESAQEGLEILEMLFCSLKSLMTFCGPIPLSLNPPSFPWMWRISSQALALPAIAKAMKRINIKKPEVKVVIDGLKVVRDGN